MLPSVSSPHLTRDTTHSGSEWRSSTEASESVSPRRPGPSAGLRSAAGLQGRRDTGEWKSMKPGLI